MKETEIYNYADGNYVASLPFATRIKLKSRDQNDN